MFIAYKSKVDIHITKALKIKKKVDKEVREQLIAEAGGSLSHSPEEVKLNEHEF